MSRKFGSIFDKKDEDQDQDGQAFYAGGSEHSGQQILGPSGAPERRIVEHFLNQAMRQAQTEPANPSANTLPVTMYRNGFTVGDESELRDFESNKEFLECLLRGEVPPELSSQARDGQVDVKINDKRFQDYTPQQRPRQVFSGTGHRLGMPAPELASESASSGGGSTVAPSTSNSEEKTLSVDEMRLKRLARFSSAKSSS